MQTWLGRGSRKRFARPATLTTPRHCPRPMSARIVAQVVIGTRALRVARPDASTGLEQQLHHQGSRVFGRVHERLCGPGGMAVRALQASSRAGARLTARSGPAGRSPKAPLKNQSPRRRIRHPARTAGNVLQRTRRVALMCVELFDPKDEPLTTAPMMAPAESSICAMPLLRSMTPCHTAVLTATELCDLPTARN
jgi:hypothetical protein